MIKIRIIVNCLALLGFLAPNGNPRLNGYTGYNNALYGGGGYNTPQFNGFNSGIRNLFGYNGYKYLCKSS